MRDSERQEMLDLLAWIEQRIRYYADPSSYETCNSDGAGFVFWDCGATARDVLAHIARQKERLTETVAVSWPMRLPDPVALAMAMRPHFYARLRDVQTAGAPEETIREMRRILEAVDSLANAHGAKAGRDTGT